MTLKLCPSLTHHSQLFAMALCIFDKYLLQLALCFGVANITFLWILCGVFDYALCHLGRILQQPYI